MKNPRMIVGLRLMKKKAKKKPVPKKAAPKKPPAKKPARKRAKKDPNAPKGPMTAYMFYSKEKRPEFQQQNKGIKFGELSKKLSESWKALSEDERIPYGKLHEKDKERHKEEMKGYVKPESSDDSDSDDSSTDKKKKRRAPKKKRAKKEKDPNAPKPATNAYMLFQKEKREEIKAQNPGLRSVTEIAKKMGEIWRKMTDDDKKKYTKQADQDKERYKREIEIYKKGLKQKQEEKEDEEADDNNEDSEDDS